MARALDVGEERQILDAVRRIRESAAALENGSRMVSQAVAGADGSARGRLVAAGRVDDYLVRQNQQLQRIAGATDAIAAVIEGANR